jgi:hypothetical protein
MNHMDARNLNIQWDMVLATGSTPLLLVGMLEGTIVMN